MIFLMIVIIAIILLIMAFMNQKKLKENIQSVENEAVQDISKLNITESKSRIFFTKKEVSKFLIDESNSKIHYWMLNKNDTKINHISFNFSEIIKCEVIQNATTKLVQEYTLVRKTFDQKTKITNLALSITIDNINLPRIELSFINSKTPPSKSATIKAQNDLQTWASLLNIVISRGNIKNISA